MFLLQLLNIYKVYRNKTRAKIVECHRRIPVLQGKYNSRSSAPSMTLAAFAAKRRLQPAGIPAVDRYLLQTPALSSKPTGRRCCCRSMGLGRTDGRTDTRPLHRPLSAYYTGGVNNVGELISSNLSANNWRLLMHTSPHTSLFIIYLL